MEDDSLSHAPLDDEVYVLLDDAGPDAGYEPPPFASSPSSLMAALRAMSISRKALRKAAVLGLVAAMAAVTSAVVTSWWDSRSARAARADTVSLRLDSVTTGAPSALPADVTTGTATAEYILEIADNGPAAVTVTGVEEASRVTADARPGYSTAAWRPVGSATVPAGGIGRVAVDVRLDCFALTGSDLFTVAGGHIQFPDTTVTVTTPNGREHRVTLTAVPVAAATAADSLDARQNTGPQIATSGGPCVSAASASMTELGTRPPGQATDALGTGLPPGLPAKVALAYEGVSVPAKSGSASFGLDFTATDLLSAPVAIDTRLFGRIPITVTDTAGRVTVTPGLPVRFTLTVKLGYCRPETIAPQAILDTAAFVLVDGSGESTPQPLSGLVADPRLRLAVDLARQIATVCS